MSKNGKLGLILGVVAGAVASAAGCLATVKAVKEIKSDLHEVTLVSPNGKNIVSVNSGSSNFAIGLTYVKLKAENENGKTCDISFLAGKNSNKIIFNWKDDEHLEFQLGDAKCKQYCDVSFGEDDIVMKYYLKKVVVATEEE